MGFFIGFLTAVLVLNCIVLCLLVLIQLPKKEAGLGLAFGGGAADALFGAGSGNVLTKATKYATAFFLVLCVSLGMLQGRYYHRNKTEFEKALQKDISTPALPPSLPSTPPASTPSTTPPSTPPATTPAGTNVTPKPTAEAPTTTAPKPATTPAVATPPVAPAGTSNPAPAKPAK